MTTLTLAPPQRTAYQAFLAAKRSKIPAVGFVADDAALPPALFDYQRSIVQWACQRGRAALFEGTGLGKTIQQLAWAAQVHAHTGLPVLIFAPLAVAQQTAAEGAHFGIPVTVCRTQADVQPGINISNYEMMDHFTPEAFGGLVLDESSILKNFSGTTRKALNAFAQPILYRLACTATPAPNDWVEIINHAEFLGISSGKEIIALYFTQDGNTTHKWRLKGHSRGAFWRWLAQWAVALRNPEDLGFDGTRFILPPLTIEQLTVEGQASDGYLFAVEAQGLQERQKARRASLTPRVATTADLVNRTPGHWMVWCDLNDESDALAAAIPDSVAVRGSDSPAWKEQANRWFVGEICTCQLMRNAKRTTASGLQQTENVSENTAVLPPNSETHAAANSTQQSRNAANKQSGMQTHGGAKIPLPTLPSDLSPLALPPPTITRSSKRRAADVPSVAEPNPAIVTPAVESRDGYTLITATRRDESEDSSAQTAILGWVSLETPRPSSNAPPCTCGGVTEKRTLVSKPSIFGFGLNWQHCHQIAFVGLSDSWEQYYQAIRRCWRFGQTEPVQCYVVVADTEGAVVRNIERKEAQATQMMQELVNAMAGLSLGKADRDEMDYDPQTPMQLPAWLHGTGLTGAQIKVINQTVTAEYALYHADSIDAIAGIPDESIGFTVFSPPFPGMYVYTNSVHDVGNVQTIDEMIEQFGYLVPELLRITQPGRSCAIHLTQMVAFKGVDGYIGLKDFRGKIIALMEEHGWIYYGEVTIDKDPQVKAIRTKDRGLLFKTLANDSSHMHMALADYLIQFRKPGESPRPIRAGASTKYNNPNGWITSEEWIEWAAPVWYRDMPSDQQPEYPSHVAQAKRRVKRSDGTTRLANGISETDVLNVAQARDTDDERHLCPLQLGVIERAVKLWSNPGDVVFTPFLGVGSEVYEAVRWHRKGLGIELKASYWQSACRNVARALAERAQPTLFDALWAAEAEQDAESA